MLDSSRSFTQNLKALQAQTGGCMCLGVDPDLERMPRYKSGTLFGRGSQNRRVFQFCLEVISTTADVIGCYKFDRAFFAALGAEEEMKALIYHVHWRDRLAIFDCKSSGVGDSTAESVQEARLYAAEAFKRYEADAATVNIYSGPDSLDPWLMYGDSKCVFVFCRSSNRASYTFQDLDVLDQDAGRCKLHQYIAFEAIRRRIPGRNNLATVGLTMGATFPDQIKALAEFMPGHTKSVPLLIPGGGKKGQGGDLEETMLHAAPFPKLISLSREILYASSDARKFSDAVRQAAENARATINAAQDKALQK